MRLHYNLDIVIKGHQEAQQALDGKLPKIAPQHLRDIGLTPSRSAASACLREVAKAVRKLSPKAAVEGIVRSSLNPKCTLHIWHGLDNGKVVSVNIGKEVNGQYKEEDSWAVKEWKRVQARRLRREEKLKPKLDKQEKKAATVSPPRAGKSCRGVGADNHRV